MRANVEKKICVSYEQQECGKKKLRFTARTRLVTTLITDDLVIGANPSAAIVDGNPCWASCFVFHPKDSPEPALVLVKTSAIRGTVSTMVCDSACVVT